MRGIFTKHALEALAQRQISQKEASECAKNPDKKLPAKNNCEIHLKNFGEKYLKLIVRKEIDLRIITAHWIDKKRIRE